ncbi:putative U-box domain-containing protein 42 isoform X2 [Dioscorea cayenensis subsp. rotundata]|uniref:RING-type E3 ubiquitin transferase n=1 Tax=Dioscorea cayennensis subsp. rotundata TaxID=55577 RepID=A0AB40ARF1_DIOCR|nr:putative U-box domain-containing protein 42 isoform X2 [Dioscorea cayenensis subsp. rotundata]
MSNISKDEKIKLTKYILSSISEIMSSVLEVNIEKENLLEFGSYLHRTTPALSELQVAENVPSSTTETLRCLAAKVDIAKELVEKCNSGAKSVPASELKSIIEQIEGVVNSIGQDIGTIPSNIFQNHKYAGTAIQSLAKEMQNAQFDTDVSLKNNMEGEQDLYQVQTSKEEFKTTDNNIGDGEMPRLKDFLKGMYYHGKNIPPSKTLNQLAEQIEPLYEAFFCPLTKKVMDDPVTIETGVTYERKAIKKWFENLMNNSQDIVCPVTKQKLHSRVLSTNLALKTMITEWKERNEASRMRIAQTALSLASSASVILDAIRDLEDLCTKREHNKLKMHNFGVTKILAQFLEYDDRDVRCETSKALRCLAEDDRGKEIIAKTRAITAAVKMLSSDHLQEKHASLSLLLQLSKSEIICRNIGATPGAILMLITMKYNERTDFVSAERAGETLKNMEKCPDNIKCMAENGLLEPLLNHIVDGDEEMQIEMVSYLGDLVLGNDMKNYVARRMSPILIKMIQCGNTFSRKAAFKALLRLSSHHSNSTTLIEAGIVPIMVDEIFIRKIYDEPVDSKEESAAVIANILESGADPRFIQVYKHGHTMASDYVIYNIVHMLRYSNTAELNKNLIRILLSLTKLPKPFAAIVSVMKETEASYNVIEFLNSKNEDLVINSGKLLIKLITHMGHTIAEALCKTREQPGSLIKKLETDQVTKKHAISVNLVAKLPHHNLTLNLALLHSGTIPIIINNIQNFQRSETRIGRHERHYIEGLVGILLRFTTTLYDHEILQMAKEQNLTTVFTELLVRKSGSDEVQRMSAIGLENLSSETVNLSKPSMEIRGSTKMTKFLPRVFSIGSRRESRVKPCPVHRGACSPSTTFCLLESNALGKLVRCLQHENVKVVEAALSAICTLLDEKVDVERSLEVLGEMELVEQVVGVLRKHKQDGIWQKAFWVIERFVVKKGEELYGDEQFSEVLQDAYQHGNSRSRQVAQNMLSHLKKSSLPRNFTAV